MNAPEKNIFVANPLEIIHLPAALPGKVSAPMSSHSAWSSRPFVLNSIPPQVITPAVSLESQTIHHFKLVLDLHVAIKLFLFRETKNVECILSVEKLFIVIDGVNLGFSLRDVDVIVDVAADEAFGAESSRTDVVP